MGTKVLRDYLADANYLQAALWPGVQALVGYLSTAPTFAFVCFAAALKSIDITRVPEAYHTVFLGFCEDI